MKMPKSEYPYNLYFAIFKEETDVDDKELRANLDYVVSRLPEKERDVIVMRFSKGLIYSEIGGIFGLSRERVRQIINNALNRMGSFTNTFIIRHGVDAFLNREICDSDDIDVLNLRAMAKTALRRGGYDTVGKIKHLLANNHRSDIVSWSKNDRHIRNFGVAAYDELVTKMESLTDNPR